MTTKRAYKLQEFVAHASSVNCLKIGRKSSRVLVTGGDDHKVNLWAIGKPNAILSLSGHASAIESVSFDSSEVFVAAGAASGTIKLWDLEEAKIVRTLTGHRSNCISVDFHPFGEFFASGSLDTNLKIWDIRRKSYIHTYKGHTRGVNAIRFTPDGRWVVSGGEDNIVKLWDLTAGKLLHEFKCHEGQIQCVDFHPHEFLLATGSADRTVKFWDLETFELIGSAGPETTGVRCMTFNPDGRTLLCGLHENLKVFSWEPIRSHDAVDVGWSKLSDLNVHDGKLLGCSYNQSCVGVWVVDLLRIEPYAVTSVARSNGHSESRSTSTGTVSTQNENAIKTSMGMLSVAQNSDPVSKESKHVASAGSTPNTLPRNSFSSGSKTTAAGSAAATTTVTVKKTVTRVQSATNTQGTNKLDVVPVIVPRNSTRAELASESRKEISTAGRTLPYNSQPKMAEFRKLTNSRDYSERENVPVPSGSIGSKSRSPSEVTHQNFFPGADHVKPSIIATESDIPETRCMGTGKLGMNLPMEPSLHEKYDTRLHRRNRDIPSVEVRKAGRTRSLVASWEQRERSPSGEGPQPSDSSEMSSVNMTLLNVRCHALAPEKEEKVSASDEDAIADVVEQHEEFLVSMQSRLTKLQVIHRFWETNDTKGAISALEKMSDHAVVTDVVSMLLEKCDVINLDICTCLLALLRSLLGSKMDRHRSISMEMLLKLVRIFGPVIKSTLSASSSVGVDLEAEQRQERCNLCFLELEKVKKCVPSLTRRGGSVSKLAHELNLALQEVV